MCIEPWTYKTWPRCLLCPNPWRGLYGLGCKIPAGQPPASLPCRCRTLVVHFVIMNTHHRFLCLDYVVVLSEQSNVIPTLHIIFVEGPLKKNVTGTDGSPGFTSSVELNTCSILALHCVGVVAVRT